MRALKWLNKLRKNERGNVLVIGAASMPLLIGATALAVDTIQLTMWKRQLQRAADSGAIAGVYARAQGASAEEGAENSLNEHIQNDLDENEKPTVEEVEVNSGSFADNTMSEEDCEIRGAAVCYGGAVRVRLRAERRLPFMSFFTKSATTIEADGVAALVDDGEYCLISLYDGDDPGITVGGNADVRLICGGSTNATGPDAITAGGSSMFVASPLAAVGGIPDGNFGEGTHFQPYSAPQEDPLKHIPTPSDADIANCQAPPSMGPQTNITVINSGSRCFTSLNVKGTLNLNPGVYFVTGDVIINSQAVINGTGVTIVLTGANGAAGSVRVNGGATVNLTAPTSGDYEGVVLYRDRRAPLSDLTFTGNSTLNLTGAMYLPSTDVHTIGTFDLSSSCLQLVVRKIDFKGDASITNECPANGPTAFARQVVRLVG